MAGTEFQPSTGKTDPVPCQNGVTSENKEVVSGGDKMETCDAADSSNRRPGKRNLSATLTASPSRRARFDLYDFNPNNDELAQIILQECPEGVNPILWDMLKSIKQDTAKSSSKADEALNRVGILEDQADNTGAQIACIEREMAALTLSNKVLSAASNEQNVSSKDRKPTSWTSEVEACGIILSSKRRVKPTENYERRIRH